MRLGLYPCRVSANTLAEKLYGESVVYERHRHRYEFNNSYRTLFVESGYTISGTSPDGRLVEIVELGTQQHPYFIATQFHPEFESRPSRPHPLFQGLVQAALDYAQKAGITEEARIDLSNNSSAGFSANGMTDSVQVSVN